MLMIAGRRWIANAGYVGIILLVATHFALWWRADALHGFWGHLDEASRWLQVLFVSSLLACMCCLFGVGWKRWIGATLALVSLVFSLGYAAGL
jgi:hypothetical protein